AMQLLMALQAELADIPDADIFVIPPPPVQGLGTAGGFKFLVQDRGGYGPIALQQATDELVAACYQEPSLQGVFTTYRASTPQLYADVDRVKAQMLNVPLANIFETLQVNLGSAYVNDFNLYGRIFQVRAQADAPFRLDKEDIARLKVRSATGELVPMGTLVEIRETAGPDLVQRYNNFVSVPLQGNTPPGVSTGTSLDTMERLANQILQPGQTFEWTEIALQERTAGNAVWIFMLSVTFVFLALAAQYESWVLPLAIMLIVP